LVNSHFLWTVLSTLRQLPPNECELTRVRLVEMLRQSLDDEGEITVYERYSRGEVDEAVARVLLGNKINHIEAEKKAFDSAIERDSSTFLSE